MRKILVSAVSTGLALVGCLMLAPTAAKADITFSLNNGLTGDIYNTAVPGPDSGTPVTGTITIDTVSGAVTGVNLHVQGDPNAFTGFFCQGADTPPCTYFYETTTGNFTEYGLLDLGNLVGYTGGPLASDSWIYLDNPPGSGNQGEEYYLSGTLPEPGLYGTLAIGLGGLLFVAYRRRRSA
jgi:hypothetical protein